MCTRHVLLLTTLLTPSFAFAGDEKLTQEVEKIIAAYHANYDRQDSAAIAEQFASGGVLVNAAGLHTDIAKIFDGLFKAGFKHSESKLVDVWPLGDDALLATGEGHNTGTSDSGAPLDVATVWTATDVREGGTWKIKMLTVVPKPQPVK